MNRTRMILAMILTYMILAVLLNSVGTLILQAQVSMGVSTAATSILDAFKDMPIAIVSFLVASLLPRLGYRRAMMLGLGLVAAACVAMPLLNAFWMVKVMLATVGAAFAL
ncbi:MAG: MFS transporter, partial [Pseudoxanthomonas sp.]